MREKNIEDLKRLEEIKEEISELVEEAFQLLPDGIIKARAKAYWYLHIKMVLGNEHEFLGSGSHTIQDSINELNKQIERIKH